MSESPEARARRRAHAILYPLMAAGAHCAAFHVHRRDDERCDRLTAELLRLESEAEALRRERDEWRTTLADERLTCLKDERAQEARAERDAALRSNAELRARIEEAAKGDDETTATIRDACSDSMCNYDESEMRHVLEVLDQARAGNAELRGMLAEVVKACRGGDGLTEERWGELARSCATEGEP